MPLSNAQSLRVIGQNLGVLSLDSFELVKIGDEYIVSSGEFGKERQRGFLAKVRRTLFGHYDLEIPNSISFTASDILRVDAQRSLQREPGSPRDRRDLSFTLRVLGDYLDRKGAGRFIIHWSKNSATVTYDDHMESFSPETLYDFGIRMYLRRSGRGA
jgi:hypothetical protein